MSEILRNRHIHFSNDEVFVYDDPESRVTLCGLDYDGILMKDRVGEMCAECEDKWSEKGWPFPLPALVYSSNQTVGD